MWCEVSCTVSLLTPPWCRPWSSPSIERTCLHTLPLLSNTVYTLTMQDLEPLMSHTCNDSAHCVSDTVCCNWQLQSPNAGAGFNPCASSCWQYSAMPGQTWNCSAVGHQCQCCTRFTQYCNAHSWTIFSLVSKTLPCQGLVLNHQLSTADVLLETHIQQWREHTRTKESC